MTDDQFMASFEDCSLPADIFDHRAHVRMAFLYLCRYSLLETIQRFSAALAKFAAAQGKVARYHETITWAFLFLICERMQRAGRTPSWEEFSADNADLLSWEQNILRKYYREETLASDLARATFLLPDKLCP